MSDIVIISSSGEVSNIKNGICLYAVITKNFPAQAIDASANLLLLSMTRAEPS